MTDESPQGRARQNREKPTRGATHDRNPEQRKSGNRHDRQYETGNSPYRTRGSEQQKSSQETHGQRNRDGDQGSEFANNQAVKSDAVGNHVARNSDGRTETHKEQQYDAANGLSLHCWAIFLVLATIVGVWLGEAGLYGARSKWIVVVKPIVPGTVLVLVVAVVVAPVLKRHDWRLLMGVGCILLCGGFFRSHTEWGEVRKLEPSAYQGTATLISDPQPIGRGVRVVLEIENQRFETWLYGRSARRIERMVAGESIAVVGDRRRLNGNRLRRLQVRHIVGRFEATSTADLDQGAHIRQTRFELAANRVREALGDGARILGGEQSALFSGLVYGDDSLQSKEMTQRFRDSGLAHLTAVSGQNVAFVLTVFAPLLTRTRRWVRLSATLTLLAWFAVLTRLEPSVVRAVTMAAISAVVLAVGGRMKAWQVLACTSVILLLVDPFLLWSVGWWLSIAGSAGLILLTPRITATLARGGVGKHPWLLTWVAPTLAAQLGVLPIAALVFGWPSAMSIPCNLLAVPVAGLVMLAGLPVALIAGVLPASLAQTIMWPLGVGVHWVDAVAALGQRLDPPVWVDVLAVVPLFALTVGKK